MPEPAPVAQAAYVTEASPMFEEVVLQYKTLGVGREFDEWWNDIRKQPQEAVLDDKAFEGWVDLSKADEKKPNTIVSQPKRGARPWYGFDALGHEPLHDFISPLAPMDSYLGEFMEEVEDLDDRNIGKPDFKPAPRPQPCNFLVTGTRGTGKSAFCSCVACKYAYKFEKRRHKKFRGQRQRVISNYYIKPVMEAGPIAFERGGFGSEFESLTPIDACDVEHPITIAKQRPRWANNCEMFVDEFADYASNLRATGTEVRDMAAWGRQLRKQATECWWNTQFLHQLPGSSVGVQIDIFARLEFDKNRMEIHCFCFDYYGQFYKTTRHRRRGLDFTGNDYDWAFTVTGVDKVFELYDTNQIIPPAWYSKADRERIQSNQGTDARTDDIWI